MNFKESLAYLESISGVFCKPGLSRTQELCRRLGNPEKELRTVHVAGTNGKGSFCAMLESVLIASGYKTGLFSSPAILAINGQIRINGKAISESRFAEAVSHVREAGTGMRDAPSSFEFLSAVAFLIFAEQKCDVVILEAGLGGRLDATNVIPPPMLSVITGVAIDHTSFLGNTIEEIAEEKAGIIKNGSPVLYGGESESAFAVIHKTAKKKGAPLYRAEREKVKNVCPTLNSTMFDYKSYSSLSLSLLGLYQPYNAINVIEATEILRSKGICVTKEALYEGLFHAKWQARFELISKDPTVIFDGAHNPDGICAAVKSIRAYFGEKKVFILSGVLKDKDYAKIAKELSSIASRAFTICPPSERALDEKEYASVLREAGMEAEAFENARTAFLYAKSEAKKQGVPLICLGSLYTYAVLHPYF